MMEGFSPITIQAYASQALATDQHSDAGSLTFPLLGLFGETGSLLSAVKKKQRDRASYVGYAAAVVEELGDVLWYLTIVADRSGVPLGEIMPHPNQGDSYQQQGAAAAFPFAALQPEFMRILSEPSATFENTLLQLAGEVGRLVTDHQAGNLANNRPELVNGLTAITRTLIQAATEAGVTLEAAAIKNLAKIFDRWPQERVYPELFDADAEPEEQLPRDLFVDIFERQVCGQTFVFQRCNAINIGDRLTDNVLTPDDYRFHDVFHFAYAAVLGWSPVIRALLHLKRKSDPKVDEAQDGARAGLIEEGVATWIFGQATELNFFDNMKPGGLPFDLLKHVRQFVSGYEPESCPLWLWEEAILQGYAAFRFLRQHRRGCLHLDMINHRLSIEMLP